MGRKELLVKHFLKPKKFIRKFVPVIGQIEFLLGIASVITGEDMDVFDEMYASLPVVGGIIGDSEEDQATLDPMYDRPSGGGLDRGRGMAADGGQPNSGGGFKSGLKGAANQRAPNINAPDSETIGHKVGHLLFDFLEYGVPLLLFLAIGLFALEGSAYGQLIGNTIGIEAQMLPDMEIGAKVQKAMTTAQCLGNAGCVKEWQFNNTQRPGSEEVGESYALQIEDYSVNGGQSMDVAYRAPDTKVPVDFRVFNPLHGLKGIRARGVYYRVKVYDQNLFDGRPVCQTEWEPLNGGFIQDRKDDEGGVIVPGSAASPLSQIEGINLKDCRLLQPALGIQRVVKTQLKYNYSSQATLQVDAMARSHMEDTGITQGFKKSQTADTPVKTYVNVEEPLVYLDQDRSDLRAVPSSMKVGFETSNNDIKYKVDPRDFKVIDSSKTKVVENPGCNGIENTGETEENTFKFSGSYEEGTDRKGYLKRTQKQSWWSKDSGPPPARCAIQLSNPEDISPTGETLTFRIDANYTVMFDGDDFKKRLKVVNGLCSRSDIQCPLIVPQSQAGDSEDEERKRDLISKCDTDLRVAANKDGCDVRRGRLDEENDWTNPQPIQINTVDTEIEEGQTAYLWKKVKKKLGQTEGVFGNGIIDPEEPIGLSDEKLSKLKGAGGGEGRFAALVFEDSNINDDEKAGDINYQKIEPLVCLDGIDGYSASREDFRKAYSSESSRAIYLNPQVIESGTRTVYYRGREYQVESPVCGEENAFQSIAGLFVQSPSDDFKQAKDGCSGVVVLSGGDYSCYS